ncbi:hypothetical protein GCM10009630_27390 [Kribbella jejuensis]|uniref:Uncharacterized protein n=1 Tax=Kribbella jejuensis TaxID=236068 RepID=A0A542EPI9_9ACTN|nr:hypothetical protein [Kribbella jejuensis]TQJ17245.1 hypothetical protein FB475_1360 [Kribbella jejuensis]
MKLYLVKEDEREVWVAALAHEHMYSYVANTGMFHDNNALRNDFYMERDFRYEPIGAAEARRLIGDGVGSLDEEEDADALAEWRSDTNALAAADVLSMAAGFDE